MKIECDKCGAKYSIADEKVRGKTFKIRCKKCTNVIIVRDAASGASAAAATAAAAAAPEPTEPLNWHIAIGGETIGPLSESEIRKRFEQGEIDRDTSVWQEGFDDWIPLGSAAAFADLPARVASNETPSESALPSASLGAFAAGAAASSPRVSDLTAQRNENSVLFSLDNLQKLASSESTAGAPVSSPAPVSTPSTAAPSSEGSGLIDIRAMGAMMGSESPADPRRREDDLVPSFGPGGLAAQPLVSEAPPIAAMAPTPQQMHPPVKSRSGGGVWLVALVFAAAAGIYGVIEYNKGSLAQFGLEPASLKAQREKDKAAEEKIALLEKQALEAKAKAAELEAERLRAEAEGDAEAGDEEEEDSDSAAGRKSSSSKSRGRSGSRGSRGPDRAAPKYQPPKPSSPRDTRKDAVDDILKGSDSKRRPPKRDTGSKAPADVTDVDCILDPSLPKCKRGSSGRKSPPKSSGASDPSLPDKLGAADIKAALAGTKSPAKACGRKHGASPGQKVAVKMKISGRSGKVSSANPQGADASSALGRCVAQAARATRFGKFRTASMTFTYKFRM